MFWTPGFYGVNNWMRRIQASEGMTGPEPHSFTGRVERSRRWTGLLGASEASAQLLDPQPLSPSCPVPKPTTRRAQSALRTFHPLDYLMTSLSPALRQAGYNFLKAGESLPKKINLVEPPTVPFCHLFGLCNYDEVKLSH